MRRGALLAVWVATACGGRGEVPQPAPPPRPWHAPHSVREVLREAQVADERDSWDDATCSRLIHRLEHLDQEILEGAYARAVAYDRCGRTDEARRAMQHVVARGEKRDLAVGSARLWLVLADLEASGELEEAANAVQRIVLHEVQCLIVRAVGSSELIKARAETYGL